MNEKLVVHRKILCGNRDEYPFILKQWEMDSKLSLSRNESF